MRKQTDLAKVKQACLLNAPFHFCFICFFYRLCNALGNRNIKNRELLKYRREKTVIFLSVKNTYVRAVEKNLSICWVDKSTDQYPAPFQ